MLCSFGWGRVDGFFGDEFHDMIILNFLFSRYYNFADCKFENNIILDIESLDSERNVLLRWFGQDGSTSFLVSQLDNVPIIADPSKNA